MLKGEEEEMKLKAVSGIMLTLLLIGILTFTFNVQTIGASPPDITVLSPLSITYVSSFVTLEFTINETASWIGYSLDNQANVTITGNWTLSGLSKGAHSVVVYANDTEGNMGASNIAYFTCGVKGDINLDGVLSGADVGKSYLIYAGTITGPPELLARADINGNGVLGPMDLADVAKMYLAYSGIYTF